MSTLIFIPDYGSDSLATAEVLLAIQRHTHVAFSHVTVAARPFNTIHTGFVAFQLYTGLSPAQAQETVLFLNTDPRTHTKKPLALADGAPLYVAELRSGAVVVSPNAGYSLSFLKQEITKMYPAAIVAQGIQFRSRDLFPQIVAAALLRDYKTVIEPPVSVEIIPDISNDPMVLHTDNYGNIKTSLTISELNAIGVMQGDLVNIMLPKKNPLTVPLVASIFDGEPAVPVLAAGSSGKNGSRYLEIAVRYNGIGTSSAAELLGFPEPGTPIGIKK